MLKSSWRRVQLGAGILVMVIVLFPQFVSARIPVGLGPGSSGRDVVELQKTLASQGVFSGKATGLYGDLTKAAVVAFQKAHGLETTGKIGPKTSALLNQLASRPVAVSRGGTQRPEKNTYLVQDGDTYYTIGRRYGISVDSLMALNPTVSATNMQTGTILVLPQGITVPPPIKAIQLRPWFGDIEGFWEIGENARVVDILSGIAFQVQRTGGHNHADVEPVTPNDTLLILKAYGDTWSWDRHPIIVEVNGVRLAASMNGMPHGYDTMPANGMEGQLCIHFLGSKTHGTDKVDPAHQAAIQQAANSNYP